MARNQKGFGVVEILLVLAAVVLFAGAGWYLMHRNAAPKTNLATTKQKVATKPYTDSSKLYSLRYPTTWVAKEAADCCEAPHDYTVISRAVTFTPASKTSVTGYGINVQADRTGSLATTIEQNWKDNNHKIINMHIYGYDAKYVQISFNGSAENYIDHNYLITHNGASVFVTFREKYYHQYPAANWSAVQDLGVLSDVLNSIRFLN